MFVMCISGEKDSRKDPYTWKILWSKRRISKAL